METWQIICLILLLIVAILIISTIIMSSYDKGKKDLLEEMRKNHEIDANVYAKYAIKFLK